MRVFYAKRSKGLNVISQLYGQQKIYSFTDGKYVPRTPQDEVRLMVHPAYDVDFYDIEQEEFSYETSVNIFIAADYNNMLSKLIRVARAKTVEEAEAIIVWQDVWGREDILKWRKQGKTVICLQHGFRSHLIYSDYRMYRPYYEPDYHKKLSKKERPIYDKKTRMCGFKPSPLSASHFFCWSPQDKKDMIKIGIKSDRIRVIGNPILTMPQTQIRSGSGFKVLFFTQRYKSIMKERENELLIEELLKVPGLALKIKTKDENEAKHYEGLDVEWSNRKLGNHSMINWNLIDWADVVVEMYFSTSSIMSIHSGVQAVDCNFFAQEKPKQVVERITKTLQGDHFNQSEVDRYKLYSGYDEGDATGNTIKEMEDIRHA